MEQNWQNRSFSRYSGQRCELAQNTPSMEPRKRANYQFFITLTSKNMFMKNWILRKKGPQKGPFLVDLGRKKRGK